MHLACAALSMEFAVDDRLASVRINGQTLTVPHHQSYSSLTPLSVERGSQLWVHGKNWLHFGMASTRLEPAPCALGGAA